MAYKMMRDYTNKSNNIEYKIGDSFTFEEFQRQTVIGMKHQFGYNNEKIAESLGFEISEVEKILEEN